MSTKPKSTKQRKAERFLRCEFNDAQLLEISKEMSQAVQRKAAAESDKKRVVKDFDARIADAQAQIEIASEKVRSGYEMRNVTCTVLLNHPRPGMKTIVRDDTGEHLPEEQMTPNELQEELPID